MARRGCSRYECRQYFGLIWFLAASALIHALLIFGSRSNALNPDTGGQSRAPRPDILATLSAEKRQETADPNGIPPALDSPVSVQQTPPIEDVEKSPPKARHEPLPNRDKARRGLPDPDRYYVRSELAVAPSVSGAVFLNAPPTRLGLAWSLKLRVFISRYGKADRIAVEESTAPAYIQKDATEQFLAAAYSPGWVGGQPVNSQLLIDVTE